MVTQPKHHRGLVSRTACCRVAQSAGIIFSRRKSRFVPENEIGSRTDRKKVKYKTISKCIQFGFFVVWFWNVSVLVFRTVSSKHLKFGVLCVYF